VHWACQERVHILVEASLDLEALSMMLWYAVIGVVETVTNRLAGQNEALTACHDVQGRTPAMGQRKAMRLCDTGGTACYTGNHGSHSCVTKWQLVQCAGRYHVATSGWWPPPLAHRAWRSCKRTGQIFSNTLSMHSTCCQLLAVAVRAGAAYSTVWDMWPRMQGDVVAVHDVVALGGLLRMLLHEPVFGHTLYSGAR
jgi:hypothetical protein